MKLNNQIKFVLALAGLLITSLACGPLDLAREILENLPTATPTATAPSATGRGFAYVWYASVSGRDSNSCTISTDPCRTIAEAIRRTEAIDSSLADTYEDLSTVSHTIYIEPGTYFETATIDQALRIRNTVDLIGSGSDSTIIDAGGDHGGVLLRSDAVVRLEGLTIQNAAAGSPGHCLSLRENASASLEHVIIQDCSMYGIEHLSTGILSLRYLSVTRAEKSGIFNRGELDMLFGDLTNNGGYGMISHGNASLTTVTIEDNAYGGVSASGNLRLEFSDVLNNGSDALGSQAGVTVGSGTFGLWGVDISGHPKEGVVTTDPTANLFVERAMIEDNQQTGIRIDGGEANLYFVTIRNNGRALVNTSSPGGVEVANGSLILTSSGVEGNHNGGILVSSGGSIFMQNTDIGNNLNRFPGLQNHGTTTIERSAIINSEYIGIENLGEMSIENSTISSNAEYGIEAVSGQLTLSYVTIAKNGISGLNVSSGSAVVISITNSLIADNIGGDCSSSGGSSAVPFGVIGTNFDTDGSCLFGTIVYPDLGLGPLSYFPHGASPGEPSPLVHPLLDGSPVIDAAVGPCPTVDQLFYSRPMGIACDPGAYEKDRPTITGLSGEIPPTINQETLCWTGPGKQYSVVSTVTQGAEVELLGTGQQAGWWVIDNPRYTGVACWLPEDKLDVDPNLDLSTLKVFPVPQLPTATFTPAPAAPPKAPTGLAANQTACNTTDGYIVKLTWKDNATNESGYRVYRDNQLIATLGANVTQYTDKLPDFDSHSYFVQAFNNAGTANSNTAQENGCIY